MRLMMQFTRPGRRGDRGGLSETDRLFRAKIGLGRLPTGLLRRKSQRQSLVTNHHLRSCSS